MSDPISLLLEAHACLRADPAGAELLTREALRLAPDLPEGLHLLGLLCLHDGRAEAAAELLAAALAARPNNADTALALGDALAARGEHAGAIARYRQVLARQPSRPDALGRLAQALLRDGGFEAAADLAAAALKLAPGDAAAWFVRGTALSALGQSREAVAALRRSLALRPDHAQAQLNLGNALIDQDALLLAEHHLRQALALDAALPEAWASLGWLLAATDRLGEAIAACDEAVRLRPGFARAIWNRSFARLLAGDFAAGWEDYEWRRHDIRYARDFPRLAGEEWSGTALEGRHLLVLASQGLGDTIQFARFLHGLAAQANRVTLACDARLVALLRQLPVQVVDHQDCLPAHDVWVDQMSLPRLLRLLPDTIPESGGYLAAKPDRGRAPGDRLRVGLVWAGNPAHSNDFRRSMPASAMLPLLATAGVTFVSLQSGACARGLAAYGIADRSRALSDFAATARLVASLDLVIAVDTSTAHLAGAMGKPVWILLPHAPDWRWMVKRPDSPWYASARLFRQDDPGDWTSVVARVAATLGALASRKASALAA